MTNQQRQIEYANDQHDLACITLEISSCHDDCGDTLFEAVVALMKERDDAREQRDRLAEALNKIADLGQMICMAWEPQSFKATEIATDALATFNQSKP